MCQKVLCLQNHISSVSFKSVLTVCISCRLSFNANGFMNCFFHVLFSAFFYDRYASVIILYWWLKSIIYFYKRKQYLWQTFLFSVFSCFRYLFHPISFSSSLKMKNVRLPILDGSLMLPNVISLFFFSILSYWPEFWKDSISLGKFCSFCQFSRLSFL